MKKYISFDDKIKIIYVKKPEKNGMKKHKPVKKKRQPVKNSKVPFQT